MKKIIVITGTPGVGKTTIAIRLAGRLGGAEVIDINDLVREKRLFTARDKYDTKIVNMQALQKEVNLLLAKSKNKVLILEGHLLCDIKVKGAVAIVIREHLNTVQRRLLKRGYEKDKLKDNLVSEALDYCGAHSTSNYKKVFEVWSGREAVNDIIRAVNGKMKSSNIDLIDEFASVIASDRQLAM